MLISTNDATLLLKLYKARVYANNPLVLFIVRINLCSNPSIRVEIRLLIKYYPPNVRSCTIKIVRIIDYKPML